MAYKSVNQNMVKAGEKEEKRGVKELDKNKTRICRDRQANCKILINTNTILILIKSD
jgi:hypothetical protein